MVGGSGDTANKIQPLADLLSEKLPNHTICSFSLSQGSEEGTSVLDSQSQQLVEVIAELSSSHRFASYDLFCTSMGAYPAVKLLLDPQFSRLIRRAIFFDPADYYLSANFSDPDKEFAWSGSQDYSPIEPVISDELTKYRGEATIDVVHLTIRNYSSGGYVHDDYGKRGEDTPSAYPRLNTSMVKRFYDSTPAQNRGKYLEVNNLPHAISRDGKVSENLSKVSDLVQELLNQT